MKFLKYLTLFFALTFICQSQAKDTITFAIGNWGPFTSEKDRLGKMAETIVRRALRVSSSSYRVKFRYGGWDEAYEDVKTGKGAATFPWRKTSERERDFLIGKEPLFISKEVFFHRRGVEFDWHDPKDLSKYKIGGIKSYSHLDIFKKNGLEFLEAASAEEQFDNLLAGKIDGFPENLYVGYYTLKNKYSRLERQNFEANPMSLQESHMFVLVSKSAPKAKELVAALDQGIRILKSTGKYEEILAFYLSNQ